MNKNTTKNIPTMDLVQALPLNGSTLHFFDTTLDPNNLLAINELLKPSIKTKFQRYINELNLKENYSYVPFEDNYKFRPDLISRKYYGSDYFYPLVLITNNINSMINFTPQNTNYKLKIINVNLLKKIFIN